MVIVDTDVVIAAIRGNDMAKSVIKKYAPTVFISVVTEMELYIGATNKTKKDIVVKVVEEHETIPINKAICELAIRLIKTYNTSNKSLFLADAFIAATCIHQHCPLITFNTKDFAFIKGLHLAK